MVQNYKFSCPYMYLYVVCKRSANFQGAWKWEIFHQGDA